MRLWGPEVGAAATGLFPVGIGNGAYPAWCGISIPDKAGVRTHLIVGAAACRSGSEGGARHGDAVRHQLIEPWLVARAHAEIRALTCANVEWEPEDCV